MVLGLREVLRHIDIDEVYRFLADIDGVHGFGAATKGVKGEAAGVAEHIQVIFVFRVALDECTVLALVDEEARFRRTRTRPPLPVLPLKGQEIGNQRLNSLFYRLLWVP